ncbi:MAG: family 43 glycosylhydrolase [Bacteroidaceae bacterium]|nr:family 43 glycosylhydrolase [Bacteroidaceae bacterium]
MKSLKPLIVSLFVSGSALAQNPVVWTKYTADPAPMVKGDTVFLYTTRDADDSGPGFSMHDWLLYTTTDMVNYTDCGIVASLDNFKWFDKENGAWALQVIERNGKYYMYCPIHGNGIAVLVADSPYGPFEDPLGHPLAWQKEHWYDIDPSPFIDDDGQAYLYWGNPRPYYVKLNRDMISYKGGIVRLEPPTDYQEGPWIFKRNGLYYMAFASTCCPEGIGYAVAHSPEGPWEAKGDIMPHTEKSRGNHPGIVEFQGQWYVYGLNYDVWRTQLQQQGKEYYHSERRSVGVAEMTFRPDGTIEPIPYWNPEGVKQRRWVCPFQRVQAETMARGEWLRTAALGERNMVVTEVNDGDYILVKGVDFAGGAKSITMQALPKVGGTIEVRLESKDGTLAATIPVKGKADVWKACTAKFTTKTSGVHDVYFVFRGQAEAELMHLDYWQVK